MEKFQTRAVVIGSSDRDIFRQMHDAVPHVLIDEIGGRHVPPLGEFMRFEHASNGPEIREGEFLGHAASIAPSRWNVRASQP